MSWQRGVCAVMMYGADAIERLESERARTTCVCPFPGKRTRLAVSYGFTTLYAVLKEPIVSVAVITRTCPGFPPNFCKRRPELN